MLSLLNHKNFPQQRKTLYVKPQIWQTLMKVVKVVTKILMQTIARYSIEISEKVGLEYRYQYR